MGKKIFLNKKSINEIKKNIKTNLSVDLLMKLPQGHLNLLHTKGIIVLTKIVNNNEEVYFQFNPDFFDNWIDKKTDSIIDKNKIDALLAINVFIQTKDKVNDKTYKKYFKNIVKKIVDVIE